MVYIFSEESLLAVDGDLKQAHSIKATITEFPLEDGSFTSDHTILKPKTFNMSCTTAESESDIELFDALVKLRDQRSVLTLQAHLSLYENFMIEGIDTTEDSSTGELVMFNISFKEVKFSKSKQVKIERKKLKGPGAKDKLQSKTNRGTVDHKKIKVSKTKVELKTKAKKGEAVIKNDSNESMLYRILK